MSENTNTDTITLNVKHPDNLRGRTTICLTGTLVNWDREAATDFAENELGAKVVGSVSKQVDYLVVAGKPGKGKLEKAAELSIPIILEPQFEAICSGTAA
jgi:NAD-dependent DNA ligase